MFHGFLLRLIPVTGVFGYAVGFVCLDAATFRGSSKCVVTLASSLSPILTGWAFLALALLFARYEARHFWYRGGLVMGLATWLFTLMVP